MLHICRVSSLVTQDDNDGRTELDSHADRSAVGSETALMILNHERPASVHGYADDVGPKAHCKTVSAMVAYDHPTMGEVYMLEIHQVILIPELKTNLLCPNQMRAIGVQVNDEPNFTLATPTDDHHAIVVPPMEENQESFRIPLSLKGVFSYFPTQESSKVKYEASPLSNVIELTDQDGEWDPETTFFKEQKGIVVGSDGNLIDYPVRWASEHTVASLHTLHQGHQPLEHLGQALEGTI